MRIELPLLFLTSCVMAEEVILETISIDEEALSSGMVVIAEDKALQTNSITVQERLERDVSFTTTTDINGEKSVSFRGLDYTATTYVQDGIPLYRSVNGVVDVMQASSNSDIYLNDGSGTSSFGVSPMGGEVSFKTKRPTDEIESTLNTALSNNDEYYRGYVGSRMGNFYLQADADLYHRSSYTLSQQYEATPVQGEGERVNSDKQQKRASFKLGTLTNDNLHLAAKVSVSRAEYGIVPNVYTDLAIPVWYAFSRIDKKDLNSYYLYADYDADLLHLSARAYYDDYEDIFKVYDDETYTAHSPVVTYDDSRLGTVLSAAIKEESYETSMVLLAEQNEHNRRGGGLTDETFSVNTLRASLMQLWRLSDQWQLDGALSYTLLQPIAVGDLNASMSLDNKEAVDGLVKLTYENETSTLYGSVAKKSRMPTMNEMFTFFPWEQANPALKPEKSIQSTLGYEQMLQDYTLVDFSVYYYDISDLIVYDATVDGFFNREAAKHYGAEFRTQSSYFSRQLWQLSYAYAHAVDSEGDRLELIPEHQFKLEDTVSIANAWEGYMAYRFLGSRYSSNSATYTNEQFALNSYHLVDLEVSYEPHTSVTLRAGVKNVLDENYEYRYGYPSEGRTFFASLSWELR